MTAPRVRRATGLTALAMLFGASGAFLTACRNDPPSSTGDAARPAESPSAAPSDAGSSSSTSEGAEEGVDRGEGAASRRDGGVDPACEGRALSLLASAVDPRCAISERQWNARGSTVTTADGGVGKGVALRQEARREGERIVLSIVNTGTTPVVVPLRWHPGRAELSFSVLAVPPKNGGGVFELAPPHEPEIEASATAKGGAPAAAGRARRWSALAELDGGISRQRVHTAQIRILPGGRASTRLVIDPRIVKRLDRSCPGGVDGAGAPKAVEHDAGEPCVPARVPPGHVVLHVGQLVAGIDVGEPARVEWDAP